MLVGSIGPSVASGGGVAAHSGMGDSVSENLKKQITELQKRLKELSGCKELSPEDKKTKQQQLRDQISELSRQLTERQQQLREEKRAQHEARRSQPFDEASAKSQDVLALSANEANSLMKTAIQFDQAETAQSVKASLGRRVRTLKAELSSDGDHALDSTRDQIGDLEFKLSNLSGALADRLESVNAKAQASAEVKTGKEEGKEPFRLENSRAEEAASTPFDRYI